MGALEEYEYPDITISQAIDVLWVIDEQSIQRLDVLANAIGHKGPTAWRGGGFRRKITSLQRYGLLAGKPSELRLSELAKSIIHPRDENDKNLAIGRAVKSVPILAKLHEKLQGKIPSEFWVPLYDLTGIEQKMVKEHADDIRKLYADAVQYLQHQPRTEVVKESRETNIEEDDKVDSTVSPSLIQFRSGEINMTLPLRDDSLDILIKFLETMKKARADEREEGELDGDSDLV